MKSFGELLSEANSLLIEEDYERALKVYNEALKVDANGVAALIKRSTCHYAMKNYLDSIQDSSLAISLDPQSHEAYYRKGLSLFAEEEYESALSAFERGLELAPGVGKFKLWVEKCATKVSRTASNSSSTTNSNQSTVKQSPKVAGSVKYRHDWCQTEERVIVEIFAKGILQQDLQVKIESSRFCVTITSGAHTVYELNVNLFDQINPEDSKYILTASKIEITLRKANCNRWTFLSIDECNGEARAQNSNTAHKGPTQIYPSSKGPKDWGQINKLVQEDKLEGDAALDKFFKDIYGNATDDQRRAMMKSFYESNGTVLSTDWNKVGTKKVEISPPEGVELKNWNSH